ncbi:MAG: ABC transporter ATP-binding protein [Leptolyngbyaceae bacterium]|nr:ABC transporter ATP-binding protein [Leptolyngbyaceae bacterium]
MQKPVIQNRTSTPINTENTENTEETGNAEDTGAPENQPPKLTVQNVYKTFHVSRRQPLTVLEDINLSLYPKEFACLVGASGCGKSTLLNIIAGLIPPTSGTISVDGQVVEGPGSDRGMVFQSYTLYPWLTVSENIAFGLNLRGMPKAEQQDRINYYLNVVGLVPFAHAYPKQLSGGMKQRVAIARALANDPDVLLMDEPFGALDAQTKEQMQQFLLELWERTHTTILMITHDVEEAIFLSQRVHVMSAHPGRLQREVPIELPEHRELDIKLSRRFIDIKREVIHSLRGE